MTLITLDEIGKDLNGIGNPGISRVKAVYGCRRASTRGAARPKQ